MSHGKLLPEEKVESRYLGTARTIRIYLPPSYETQPRRRASVLYLHDGQNVFSAAGTDCCFGWGNWELDKTVDRLVAEGRIREIIMVAIDNSCSRYAEYRGALHPADKRSARGNAKGATKLDNARFEAYANFLIKELKPRIDRQHRTRKSAADTAVMGSSMGGICSLSLAWKIRERSVRQQVSPARSRSKRPTFSGTSCVLIADASDPFASISTAARSISQGTMMAAVTPTRWRMNCAALAGRMEKTCCALPT
jgi:predicted alpha/beta superfamily hydrolase